jgi:DNA-binding transcriptional ArsR family regulator
MNESSSARAEAIFHPVRMRIIRALLGRELTARGIAEVVGDVPPATLYRHLNQLVDAGVLCIVSERQVRGASERTFGIVERKVSLEGEDVATFNLDEHLRYFSVFVAGLLEEFARYLERDEPDLARDGVSYRQVALWLSDDEFVQMREGLRDVLVPLIGNQPTPERTRRLVATILLPVNEDSGQTAGADDGPKGEDQRG